MALEEASRLQSASTSSLSWAPRSTSWGRSSVGSSSSSSSSSSGGRTARVRVDPEEISYSIVIESCSRKGDVHGAAEWLQEMKASPVRSNVFAFNAVIVGYARLGILEEAKIWLVRMKAEGLEPNVVSYTAVIDSCAKAGDSVGAVRFFETMLQNSIVPNAVTFNSIINCHARLGDADGAQYWLDRMRQVMPPDEISYNSAIHGCANARPKRAEQAERLFREMRAAGLHPTLSTLSALERAAGFQKSRYLCSALGIDIEKAKRHRPPPQHRRVKPLVWDAG